MQTSDWRTMLHVRNSGTETRPVNRSETARLQSRRLVIDRRCFFRAIRIRTKLLMSTTNTAKTMGTLLAIRQLEINFPFIRIKLVPYFGVDRCGFDVYTIFRSLIFVEQVFQLVWREFLPPTLCGYVCQLLHDFTGRQFPALGRWPMIARWAVLDLYHQGHPAHEGLNRRPMQYFLVLF